MRLGTTLSFISELLSLVEKEIEKIKLSTLNILVREQDLFYSCDRAPSTYQSTVLRPSIS